MENITHHDINQAVSLEFDKKRIEKLKRKHQPKTRIERQKPLFYFLVATAVICELVDITFTFSGIIHFASTQLSQNGFFVSVLIAIVVVLLGLGKHKIMDIFHHQRLDDGDISKSVYVAIFALFAISSLATYNVTPAALAYLTKEPALVDLDSISNHYDTLLAADLVVISKEVNLHDTTANSIFTAAEWQGRIDRKSRKSYETALDNKSTAQSKLTAVTLARTNEKQAALVAAQAKNEKIKETHLTWCNDFGFWLSIFFVLIELLYFPAKWFCENYERAEVLEAKAKMEALEKVKGGIQYTAPQTAKDESKEETKVKVKDIENEAPKHIGFVFNQAPKEGDILKGEGRKVDKVWVEVGGKLRPMKPSEINILIKGQSEGSPRIAHLENLKKLIEK